MSFFTSNNAWFRLLRTIVQGVIGVIIANLDSIIGTFSIPDIWKPLIAALVMAILSPIMAEIGKPSTKNDDNDDEIDDNIET